MENNYEVVELHNYGRRMGRGMFTSLREAAQKCYELGLAGAFFYAVHGPDGLAMSSAECQMYLGISTFPKAA